MTDHIHGTPWGYRRHRTDGTTPCQACTDAATTYGRTYRAGHPRRIPAILQRQPGPPPANLTDAITARTHPDRDHLIWTGHHNSGGQPAYRWQGRMTTAARLAWVAHHGTDPVGRLRRLCGEPSCVAPAHHADDAARRVDALYAAITGGTA